MKLFSEYQLGNALLKNRIVMAPMTRSRAVENNTANALMAEYYGQRAGAGLIITEGTSPSPNGLGYPRIPAAYNEQHTAGWKLVTAAVHNNGGKIFLQIMHTGRVTHEANLPEGAKVLAPSPIQVSGEMYTDTQGARPHNTPLEMTIADIQEAVGEYVQAAKNAIEAGFDGIEIHAANGYLCEQFLNPAANHRSDEYGGNIENRSRFVLEVAKGIADAIGKDKTGVRLSPYGVFNDMGPFDGVDEAYGYLAEELGKIGVVYIHIVDHSGMGAPVVPVTVKEKIRDAFGGTVIISGGYDKARAEQDLENGLGHLVAFGRPFIANPDLVERLEKDAIIEQPDMDKLYTPGKEGYTDYPTLEGQQVN